ncbi:MAG: YggS family pyridoxal phosphate-dependent enzyme [Nitrospirae bacterium]|nr:YggS family pyridoxal phosphate-dependent enzyme [Nitrospirota bacterium]
MGISENLRRVQDGIAEAERRAGREPGSVQEALAKQEEMAGLRGHGIAPEWHLIGSLQKNKARQAVGAFSLIHSLDGVELAVEIDKRAAKLGIVQDVLLEVNVSGEASKHGVRPEDALAVVREVSALPNIRIVGLMCIPPFTDDAEDSRPHFRALAGLLREINGAGFPMHELSMGMTQDYEVAAEEGATLVRVGTAIFGARG